ncbi:MAG: RND family transporter [Thermoplasmata archaeon]|nr:MAG: RND family transporter [Thermoplasmata archaeon]
MLRFIADLVEKRPKAIIIGVIIITIITAYVLYPIKGISFTDEEGELNPKVDGEPAISFKTDVEKFLPDNPLVKAQERVDEYFGEEFYAHVIYCEEDNEWDNVIKPKVIRSMYNVSVAARSLPGVDGSLSLADAINEIVKWQRGNIRDPEIDLLDMNYQKTDYLISDKEIQEYLDIIFGVLNGSLNITEFAEIIGDLPIKEENIVELELALGLLFSEDFSIESQKAKSTIIIVQMNGTLSSVEAKELAGKIREVIEQREYNYITTQQTSQYLISYDIDLNSEDTFTFLAGGIFGLIILILALSFRKISYVLIPVITLLIATIWTIGTMYLLGLSVTAMMVAVIPLLIGLGVDYSVHVLRRYQEELRKGKTVSKAIRSSIINVGGAIGLAMITTVIAFLSNLTSAVVPIRDFGISCAAGVFYAFLLTMTFHCAIRSLLDKRAMTKYMKNPTGKHPLLIGSWHTEKDKKMGLYDRFSDLISKAVSKHPAVIAGLTVFLTVGSVIGAMNVESEFTMQEFLPEDWDSVKTSYLILDNFEIGSYAVSYILIEGDDLATKEALADMKLVVERTEDDRHVVRINTSKGPRIMTESIFDISKMIVQRNSTVGQIYKVTDEGLPNETATNSDIRAFFDYLLSNDEISDPLSNQTFGQRARKLIHRNQEGMYDAAVIKVYISTFTSTDNREMHQDLKDNVKDLDFGVGAKVTVTGLMVLTIETVDSLQANMINSTIIAVILAAIILIFLYRNVLLGIMPPIPVVLCSLWIVGTMFLLSISLNILTVMVTALTIGLGIDYSIHVMERFKEEREKQHRGIYESVHITIMSTGTALTISAVTTILGFGVLIFSPMPIAQQFGVITAITIIYSFLAAVLVLPIILIFWAKRKEKKEIAELPQFASLEKIEVKKEKK